MIEIPIPSPENFLNSAMWTATGATIIVLLIGLVLLFALTGWITGLFVRLGPLLGLAIINTIFVLLWFDTITAAAISIGHVSPDGASPLIGEQIAYLIMIPYSIDLLFGGYYVNGMLNQGLGEVFLCFYIASFLVYTWTFRALGKYGALVGGIGSFFLFGGTLPYMRLYLTEVVLGNMMFVIFVLIVVFAVAGYVLSHYVFPAVEKEIEECVDCEIPTYDDD